jgi:DNA-binding XRE family transcriptional regulator
MSGRNKFSELRDTFLNDPERGVARREEIEALGRAYDALVALHELREAAGATQADVAQNLGVSQPYVAKLEKRGDMSLTTLSSYLAALGGRLEVRAIFPEHPEENVSLALPATVGSDGSRESISGK